MQLVQKEPGFVLRENVVLTLDYIVDLMEGRFPNVKLMNKSGSLEEERRLMYVAITRAKENLVLSYAKRDALKGIEYEPSRFLYEAKLLHKNART